MTVLTEKQEQALALAMDYQTIKKIDEALDAELEKLIEETFPATDEKEKEALLLRAREFYFAG